MNINSKVWVIGGGLAGCEAAWFLAKHDVDVVLFEMRPNKGTPAHTTDLLAELVCSNSLRSNDPCSAVGLLKDEMRDLGSIVLESAEKCKVPAGKALAVDREKFSKYISEKVYSHPKIEVRREEVTSIPEDVDCIIATGPLTSEGLSLALVDMLGNDSLYFYDAIAPIINAESVNTDIAYVMDRYASPGEGDYLNCPMNRDEYLKFWKELCLAKAVSRREFEKLKYFEGCMPVEAIAKRGEDSLRFGAMKPVGLACDPDKVPYAVVQLRKEDENGSMLNLVGFQTGLSYSDQDRILRMIPGLENADFFRYGSMHRNTFINSPGILSEELNMKERIRVSFAGQISGVEGYVESSAMGILSAIYTWFRLNDRPATLIPQTTVCGALVSYINNADPKKFQPMKANFGILPPLGKRLPKKEKKEKMVERARVDIKKWIEQIGL